MTTSERSEQTLKYLSLLARQFPNQQSVFSEIINLQAILNLPKGTEHFMSDPHGEYEAFMHIINNCSGVIREHIDIIFGDELDEDERADLATLIYYPVEKLARVRAARQDSPSWLRSTLDELVQIARSLSSRYTRSKVRKAIPHEYAYIIDELLHTHPDEENYRNRYHERIIDSILETGAVDDFICSLSDLIKRLAVDHLHIVGDIFDRGGHADKIMDMLMGYHSLDIEWGNHDVLWMGAAAGEPACIMNVLRNNLRYNNYEILENGYGIALRQLSNFADRTYAVEQHAIDALKLTPLIKAVNVMLFKLEGQIIRRHPEFDMEGRQLLERMDLERGTVMLEDGEHPLVTRDFPTVDPENPYELSPEEASIVERLVQEFTDGTRLQRHIEFLYSHGSLYKASNKNLLFHGCMPLNDDGTFASMSCNGMQCSGKSLFDFCDQVARKAWRVRDRNSLDWIWYLWCGRKSPFSGRVVKTFERSYIEDRETWKEPIDAYFELAKKPETCDAILRDFHLRPEGGHIINGHTPVKTGKGEVPIRADGKLLVIDGGFCRAYQPQTGIAGYTLIANSRGLRLKAHEPFRSVEEALDDNADIQSETDRFETEDRLLMISDTDTGEEIREHINDLRMLLDAYRNGVIAER